MKKLIYTLFILVGFSSFGFSQETNNTTRTNGSIELVSSKTSGEFVFHLPVGVTAEDVKKNSAYYTHYFTVSFDVNSHEATIHMVENTTKNRYVIARFLTACGMKYVQVDGKALELHDFVNAYLK